MRRVKRAMAVLLVVSVMVLSGCSAFQKFDAAGYTKACLDASYKGEFDEYIKLTKSTKEEAEKEYNKNLELTMNQLTSAGISDESTEKYKDLYVEIFKKLKYDVKEAKENEDKNFTVQVEVQPAKIFDGVMEAAQTEMEEFVTSKMESGEMPSEEEIMEQTFVILHDKMSENLENLTYGEKQTIEISVTKDSNNVYSISDEDLLKIDEAMYDKSGLTF